MSRSKVARTIEHVRIADIVIPSGRRPLRYENKNDLKQSLQKIGLQTPITLRRMAGGSLVLVAGNHRIDAAKSLGWETIDAFVVSSDEVDDLQVQMMEISENLHRTELSALDRSIQIATWIKLHKQVADIVRESTTIDASQPETHGKRAGQQPGGTNEAARKLGIVRAEAHRSVTVDGLSEDAKEAARTAGLADNRSALLAAAKETEPAKQVEVLKQRAEKPAKVDPRLASQMKARATHEIGLLVVTYMQADMITALIANLNIGGGPADIIAAINNAMAKKR